MNTSNTHILSEHGIMSGFSIAKKISNEQIKKLAQQLKMSENSKEFRDHLKRQILRDTQLALHNNKIPGIISNQNDKKSEVKQPNSQKNQSVKKFSLDEKKKAKLALFASLIVQKILEQKSTVEEKCFLIVQIANGLGLEDSDFKNYHARNEDVDDTDEDDEF